LEEEGEAFRIGDVVVHFVLFPFAWREPSKNCVFFGFDQKNGIALAVAEFVERGSFELMF
jgi:hypothetical protein